MTSEKRWFYAGRWAIRQNNTVCLISRLGISRNKAPTSPILAPCEKLGPVATGELGPDRGSVKRRGRLLALRLADRARRGLPGCGGQGGGAGGVVGDAAGGEPAPIGVAANRTKSAVPAATRPHCLVGV